MLDAQTIEHLVNTGSNVEDATIKAPEESVARFQKNFGQQLYKKKYPPKGHVYFRGATNPFTYHLQINFIWQRCKIPQVTAVNCWGRQQIHSQIIQSYSFFWQCRRITCVCQLNMQSWWGSYFKSSYKINCWLPRVVETCFQVGNWSKERESGGRWLRIYCVIFHIWYVQLT